MSVKVFIYFFVMALVLWAMNSVNINSIFKKNKVLQARVFYFLLGISLTYIITSFIFDFFVSSKFF